MKGFFGGSGSSLKDTGTGVVSLFTHNPLTSAKAIGAFAWQESGKRYVDFVGACGRKQWVDCNQQAQCTVLNHWGLGCVVRDMVLDDRTKDDLLQHRYAHGLGRFFTNAGLFVLPAKVPGLNRLGSLGRGGKIVEEGGGAVEQGGKVSQAYRTATTELDRARRIREDQLASALPEAEIHDLLRDYTALGGAEKTRFLGELSQYEFFDLWGRAPAAGQTDMFAHLSAADTEKLYKDAPAYQPRILANVPPELVPKLAPKPRGHRFVPWRKARAELFDGAPKVNDVAQGWYQTCWCLGSMQAVVAKAPDLITHLIRTNKNGTMTVRFPDGEEVTVTSDLPLDGAHTGRVAWPAIMEKAFAQRYGGTYAAGHPARALEALTGRAPAVYDAANPTPALHDIASRFDAGHAFTVTFHAKTSLRELSRYLKEGIVGEHTYAVVAVDERSGTVTLANPRGTSGKTVTLTDEDLHNPRVISRLVDVPTH